MRAEVWNKCCRDLRTYLETALAGARGGAVSVKMKRLLRAEMPWPDRVRYSHCLSHILRQWQWQRGVYVIPRQEAEKMLESFDKLCGSVGQVGGAGRRKPHRQKEEHVYISFTLPNDMLYAVDEYARRRDLTRSEVIRQAVQKLIEMRCVLEELEELDRARTEPMEVVALRLPRDLLRDLDERAATLRVPRSALVRYAIHQLLQKATATAEP